MTDVRKLVSPTLRNPITITGPRWSPDGQLIAYLQVVSETVPPRELDGLSWLERRIYLLGGAREYEFEFSLWVIPSTGGTPRQLIPSFPGSSLCAGAGFAWAADSHSLVCAEAIVADTEPTPAVAQENPQECPGYRFNVFSVDVADGSRKELASLTISSSSDQFRPLSGSPLALDPTGGRLAVMGYDGDTPIVGIGLIDLETGHLRQVVELPRSDGSKVRLYTGLAWGADGRIYLTRTFQSTDPATKEGRCSYNVLPDWPRHEIWSVDHSGQSLRRETHGPSDCHPAPSPTAGRLAFVRLGSMYLREPDGTVRPLVERGYRGRAGNCDGPLTWSPDGEQIAFVWNANYRTSLWTARVLPRS